MMNPIQRFSISGSDLKIPVREVTKYLGYGKQVPVDDSLSLINKAVDKVREVSEGKGCYSVFEIKADTATGIVSFPYGETESHILARHLDGCSEAYLMAVTIGAGFDRLLQRTRRISMSETAVLQAAGAAAVEEVCNILNSKLEEETEKKGLHLRLRYSPGYGDFALENQRGFFRLLDPAKNAGITLMDSLIMAPEKSVTAVIGISENEGAKEYETEC
jgi:hypothetical protein